MSTATETALGTHSEVGKLRTVMVHRPDLAHERLSPTNCHELLFDDVIWVRRARQEHDAFVDLMRERGVEVLLLHELLAADARGRRGARVAAVPPRPAGGGHGDVRRAASEWLTEMPADELATRLTGGVTVLELPDEIRSAIGPALRPTDFVLRAAAEPALHARHERLDLRRRVAQPDVLAGAPARDAERRGDLPLPPALPRRRLPDLVRRRRPRLGHGADRGRRHDARRRRRRPRRHGRAQHRARGEHPRQEHVRGGRGAARDRRADAARARRDAPRHGLHASATATWSRSTSRSSRRSGRSCSGPGGAAGVQAEVSERSFLDEVQDALGIDRAEARHDRRRRVRGRAQPVGRRQQRRRARAGRRRRATSATRRPTRSSRRPASRCSPSPARSSAAAAAAATA